MQAFVIRPFPVSTDGINTRMAKRGEVVNFSDESTEELEALGYVSRSPQEAALEVKPGTHETMETKPRSFTLGKKYARTV